MAHARWTVQPAIDALIRESEATGLPLTFKTDLTKHDATAIRQRGPSATPHEEAFGWLLYSHGTHLMWAVVPGQPDRVSASRKPFFELCDEPRARFYLWNGNGRLQQYPDGASLDAALREIAEEYREVCAARSAEVRP